MAPRCRRDLVRQLGQADREHLAAILGQEAYAEFRVAEAVVRAEISHVSASKLVQRRLTADVIEQTRTLGKGLLYFVRNGDATMVLGLGHPLQLTSLRGDAIPPSARE